MKTKNGSLNRVTFSLGATVAEPADAGATAATSIAVLPSWLTLRVSTVEDLADTFVERCRAERLADWTARSYRSQLRPFLAWCAERGLTDPAGVSPDLLRAYVQDLRGRGLSDQTVSSYVRSVRALFGWAKRERYLVVNPFEFARFKQPKLPIQPGFTPADVKAMAALLAEDLRQVPRRLNVLRDRALLLVLYDTGMRRSEVSKLDLGDLIEGDALRDTLIVRGKGNKQRVLELNGLAQTAIREYLVAERPRTVRHEAVFLARPNMHVSGWHRLTADGVSEAIAKLAKRAGLTGKKLGPHGLRHGFAKAFLEQEGALLDDLQALLGHETLAMSQHYARQWSVQARKSQRDRSPLAQLGLELKGQARRGRPRKEP